MEQDSLERRAREALRRYDMLSPGCVVLAGLSGGADSVALLHWLHGLRRELPFTLLAAHVNHGLRGAESDGDEAFCLALCEALEVPLHVRRIDAAALARERHVGLEEAGRAARYEFFNEIPADRIALAHTLSDRIETMLLNMRRGAALRGLLSIPAVRRQEAGIRRQEAGRETANSAQNPARVPLTPNPLTPNPLTPNPLTSNPLTPNPLTSNPLTSNPLTSNPLTPNPLTSNPLTPNPLTPNPLAPNPLAPNPLTPNPLTPNPLMPNSLIIRPLIECSRAQVEAYCAAHGLAYRTDSSNFDLSFRRNQIRREVLPPLQLNDGVMRRMFRALEADEAFLQSAARNAQPTAGELPEALQTRLLREQLVLAKREPTQARMAALRQTGARRAVAPARNISVKLEWADWNQHENFTNQGLANRLDCDTIRGSLVIGRRAPGDRMRMVNGAGTKPLKKLFQERGVPPEERGQPVVLRDDAGVVWIEGFGCAHRCRITDKTKKTLRIIIQEG